MVSIDIVVPCYQYGAFLADCVGSIERQGIEQLRILIIDNASSDDSVEVANRLASANKRIEVVARRKNLGPNASYNEGIDWAQSDYMMIVDADDLVAEGCLASGVAFLELHHNISFAHGAELQLAFEAGVVPATPWAVQANSWAITSGRRFIERTCRYPVNTVANSSVIVRTTAQKMAGYYNPRLPHSDDLEMWLRLARLGDVGSRSAVHGIRRIHARQLTQGYARDGAALDYVARLAAFNSFFEIPGVADAARLRSISRRSLSAKAYWSALSHAYRRRYGDARELLRFVWAQCPSMVVLPPVNWLLRIPGLFQRLQVLLFGMAR